MHYQRRIIDIELETLLPQLPAIALDGPKGVGKTATATRHASSSWHLDDQDAVARLRGDPAQALASKPPILLDEWQREIWLWDAVRRAVDDGAAPASFLLTGSATPISAEIHSGAGRIVSLRMRPMAICERSLVQPTVSLTDLLTGTKAEIGGECELRLGDYAEEIEASGFPGIRSLTGRARRLQLDSYLTRAMERDLADEQQVTVRRPQSLRGWLTAYAAASSMTAAWEAIRRAATPGDADPPSKTTTIRYRDWLASLWLLDPIPAWRPLGTSLRALAQAPKHQLADPALAARLLQLTAGNLLAGEASRVITTAGPMLGALFESLATLSVRVLAQAADAQVWHLRTQGGDHEIDLIVEGADGRIVAIEVKLAAAVNDHDVRQLHWLADSQGDRLADRVVLSTGSHAYRRVDGIAVVPLALLGL